MRAVRLGAMLGIVGVAAHSFVDFGLPLMTNAVVLVTLIIAATTIVLSPKRKGARGI